MENSGSGRPSLRSGSRENYTVLSSSPPARGGAFTDGTMGEAGVRSRGFSSSGASPSTPSSGSLGGIQRVQLKDDEELELLAREGYLPKGEPPGEATFWGSVANVANNVLGAGLLVLPSGMSQGSTLPSLFFMIFVCIAGSYTMVLISRCCEITGVYSFSGLCYAAFQDRRWAKAVQLSVGLTVVGTTISYVVLLGDFFDKVFDMWFPGTILENRVFIQILLVTAIVFPLSSLESLHSLRHTSAMGVFAILFTAVTMIVTWFDAGAGIHDAVQAVNLDFGIFIAIALINVSFTAHYNAPKYFKEMKNRTSKEFVNVVFAAFGVCLTVYICVALAGYFQFGEGVCGDVLSTYGRQTQFTLARLMMGFVIVFTYPLPFNSLRTSFNIVFLPNVKITWKIRLLETFLIMCFTTFVGISFPEVEVILAYKGATFGSLIVYVLPAMFYLRLAHLPTWRDRLPAQALLWFGLISGLVGVWTTVKKQIDNAPKPAHCSE